MNLKLKSLVLSAASIAASTVVAKGEVCTAADGSAGLPVEAVVSTEQSFLDKVVYRKSNKQEIAAYLVQNADAFALTEKQRELVNRYRVLLAEQGGFTPAQASGLLKHFQVSKCLSKRLADVAAKAVIPATGAAAVVAAVLGFHAPSRERAKMVVKSIGAALANPTSPLAAIKAQATDCAFERTMAATLVGPNSLFAKEVKEVTALYDALEKANRKVLAEEKGLNEVNARTVADNDAARKAHADDLKKAEEAKAAAEKVKAEAVAKVAAAQVNLFRKFDIPGILSSLVNSGIASRGLTYEELYAKIGVLFAAERARIADLKKNYDDAKKAADKVQEELAKKIEAARKKCDELVAKAANDQAKEAAQKSRDTEVARINHEIELKKLEIEKLEALSKLAEIYANVYHERGLLFGQVGSLLQTAIQQRMALDRANAARGLNLSVDPAVVDGLVHVVGQTVNAQLEAAKISAQAQLNAAQATANYGVAAHIAADEVAASHRAIDAGREAANRSIAEAQRRADAADERARRAIDAADAAARQAADEAAAARAQAIAAIAAARRDADAAIAAARRPAAEGSADSSAGGAQGGSR